MQVKSALEMSGLWHYNDSDRLSLSGIQMLLNTICMVTVIKGEEDLLRRLRCSCTLAAKGGKCSHMAFAAFLHGHQSTQLEKVLEQISKKGIVPSADLPRMHVLKNTCSNAKVPSASAWKTMAQIMSEAAERYRHSKKKKQGPDGDAVNTTPAKEKNKPLSRTEMLKVIAGKLLIGTWEDQFTGMHMAIKHRVSPDEARSHRIHRTIFSISQEGTGPLRKMANDMCTAWRLEDNAANARQHSSLKVKEEVKEECKEEGKEDVVNLKRKAESSSSSESSGSSSSSEQAEAVRRKLAF